MSRRAERELVVRLRAVPLFSMLSGRALRAVASSAREADVPAGEVLVREGDRDRDLYLILRGEAIATSGRTTVVMLGVGDYFGEFALIGAEPRSATITAATDMRVMVLSADGMDEAMRRDPALAGRMRESRERRMAMLMRAKAADHPPAL